MTAYILIHGLAGSRKEVEYLYGYLKDKGIDVYSLVLKGHERCNSELAKTSSHDWLNSAQEQIVEIKKWHEEIVIIGFSMGGLIAANLYEKVGAKRLVFVNTPIYYWDIKKMAGNVIGDIKSGKYANIRRYFTASTDKPLPALLQFVLLLNKTKRKLRTLRCNALILQSRSDDTVNAKSAEYIFNSIQGEKQIKYYDGGGHHVFNNEIRDEVCADIYNYIKGRAL